MDIKNDYTTENDYLAALTENGIWIKDKTNNKTSIIRADGLSGKLLKNVSIYQFDENGKHNLRIESLEADINDYRWKLIDSHIYYTDNNKSIKYEEYYFLSNLDINGIKGLFANLDSISFWELNKLKKNYKYLGYSTREIDSEFQRSLAFPIFFNVHDSFGWCCSNEHKIQGKFHSLYCTVHFFVGSDLLFK